VDFSWLITLCQPVLSQRGREISPNGAAQPVDIKEGGLRPTMAKNEKLFYSLLQSTIFLEPFSIAIQSKSKYNVPAYMYATQFAEEFGPFPCNIPGTDYNAFYKHWTANKWFTEVAVGLLALLFLL